jgi:hypothetical protein
MWGDRRQWWVDGVPVRGLPLCLGFVLLVLAPMTPLLVSDHDWGTSDWQLKVLAALASFVYFMVVVPWVMRLLDLRRRRREQEYARNSAGPR